MNNTKINAVVVADSINPYGNRITSLLVTMPRIVLAEFNTHRIFSRNTSSSRAISFNKMVESVEKDPFIPIAWQKDHKGMQGTEYFTNEELKEIPLVERWLEARDEAIEKATELSYYKVTKQLCNRLLEPFQWYTSLVTATEYDNFFSLRMPIYEIEIEGFGLQNFKSKREVFNAIHESEIEKYEQFTTVDWLKINKGKAEIHLMELAECMWNARNESKPKQLEIGQWHIPFEDKIDTDKLGDILDKENRKYTKRIQTEGKVKIATSMAARTSYTVVGNEKEFSYENHIALHDRLISQVPLHASPMEHCARVPTEHEYFSNTKGKTNIIGDTHPINGTTWRIKDTPTLDMSGWFDNYHGFQSYRNILENEISI